MKFAVFGEIHGNIEALKAASVAAQAAGVEKIYHLGELGGFLLLSRKRHRRS